MKQFKRARVSIIRQPSKSLILFAIIVILGIFSSGAITISQAIQNTENNLLRRIPPLATVTVDVDANVEHMNLHGEWPQLQAVTREILEAIGDLSYVREFDFASYDWFFSSELSRPQDIALYTNIDWFNEFTVMQLLMEGSRQTEADIFEPFVVKGVHHPTVLDLEEGIIELIAGRVFTQAEIENDSLVALVSQAFANTNRLSVGSAFILESHIYDTFDPEGNFNGWADPNDPEGPLLEVHEFELEVIGIFIPTVEMEGDIAYVDLVNHIDLNVRLYAPIGVTESSREIFFDYIREFHPESLASHYPPFSYNDVVFALYDSLDLVDFYEAASALLPDFWMIDDLRNEFAAMSNSLTGLQGISNGILIGVSITSVVVLGLLILLFLYDRKEEIGVYLALGESRKNIVVQMLIETIIVSMVALSISLFIGNVMASSMTYSMLRQELIDNPDVVPNQDLMQELVRMGFSIQMTAEEMVAAYDVTLDGMTILMFSGAGVSIIILSTILPIIYLTRLKPKDILIKSSVG